MLFRNRCNCALIFVGATTFFQTSALSAIIRVDANSTETTPDGSSWIEAFASLSDAIAYANTLSGSDQIWVRGATGAGLTYYPDQGTGLTPGDRGLSFTLANNLEIYGGFSYGDSSLSQRNPETNITILSGDLSGTSGNDTSNFGNRSDNSYHVVKADSINSTARLDGFRIRGGKAEGSYPQGHGGGILLLDAAPLIVRCVFIDNEAEAGGGGAYAVKDAAAFINCRFLGNRALDVAANPDVPMPGGGIYVTESTMTLVNCEFSGNTASDGAGVYGPFGSSVPTINIDNSTFSGNTASSTGGGLSAAGTTTINNSIFWGNSPTQAIANSGGSVNFTSCDIQGGMTNLNPLFVDANGADNTYGTLDDDVRLDCISPCINIGDDSIMPSDTADLDLDGTSDPLSRDLAMLARVQGSPIELDMGAYEKPYTAPACRGEASGDACVGVADLLAVIATWGACGSPCPTDIMPQPCGNGQVNVQDLLTVIDNWGCGCNGGPPPIEDVEDCMELCSGLYEWGSEDWLKCVNACAAQFEE